MAKQGKCKHKTSSPPLGLLSPPTVLCVSALCIDQTSLFHQQEYLLNPKQQQSLASTRQLLKRQNCF